MLLSTWGVLYGSCPDWPSWNTLNIVPLCNMAMLHHHMGASCMEVVLNGITAFLECFNHCATLQHDNAASPHGGVLYGSCPEWPSWNALNIVPLCNMAMLHHHMGASCMEVVLNGIPAFLECFNPSCYCAIWQRCIAKFFTQSLKTFLCTMTSCHFNPGTLL